MTNLDAYESSPSTALIGINTHHNDEDIDVDSLPSFNAATTVVACKTDDGGEEGARGDGGGGGGDCGKDMRQLHPELFQNVSTEDMMKMPISMLLQRDIPMDSLTCGMKPFTLRIPFFRRRIRLVVDPLGLVAITCLLCCQWFTGYLYYCMVILPRRQIYPDSLLYQLVYAVYLLLNLCTSLSALNFATTNPGTPRPDHDTVTDKSTFCECCVNVKAKRVQHCYRCHQCVLRMDHHCVWLNNCVGEANHYIFMLTLCYSTLLMSANLVLSLLHYTTATPLGFYSISVAICISLLTIASAVSLLISVCLVVSQFIALRMNKTTLELMVITEEYFKHGSKILEDIEDVQSCGNTMVGLCGNRPSKLWWFPCGSRRVEDDFSKISMFTI